MRRPHKLSRKGARFIGKFEGLRLTAYRDPVGVLTIGYGHTGPDVKVGQRISKRKALRLLRRDAAWAAGAVRNAVKVPINQAQFDAITSAVFNLGPGEFLDPNESTFIRLLNAGRYRAAAGEFPRWNKAGGRVLDGLTRRRYAERRVFMHGYRRRRFK